MKVTGLPLAKVSDTVVCTKMGVPVLLARSENVRIEYTKTAPLLAEIDVVSKLDLNASVIV